LIEPSKKNIWVAGGVLSLLIVLLLQLALSVRQNSITWDEDDHIYAGYMSWKHADFGLNPEHPPLVKMLAAVPLLSLPLKMPVPQNRNFKHEAFLGGKDFLFKNDADKMLFRARMAAALLTLLLALLVFLAARRCLAPERPSSHCFYWCSTPICSLMAPWWERMLASLVSCSPPSMPFIVT